jgi:hypothetical protein
LISVASSVTTSAPTPVVFGYLSEPRNQVEWTPNFLELLEEPDGPPRLGVRYRGRLKLFGSLDFTYDEFEPGRSYRVSTGRRVAPIWHRFEISDTGSGSRVDHEVTCDPKGPLRLTKPLLTAAIRRMVADLDRQMKRVLDAQTSPAA